jgi:hypothetical protein
MTFTKYDLQVLEIAAKNYDSLWKEWLVYTNDGTCDPEYITRNVKEFSSLVTRIRNEGRK